MTQDRNPRTRLTITLEADIEDVATQRLFKWLRKKCNARVIDVHAERIPVTLL